MDYTKYLAYFNPPSMDGEEGERYYSLLKGTINFRGDRKQNIFQSLSDIVDTQTVLYKYRKDPFMQRLLNSNMTYIPEETIFLGYLPIFLSKLISVEELNIFHGFFLNENWETFVKKLISQNIGLTWKGLKEHLWIFLGQSFQPETKKIVFKVIIRTLLLLKLRLFICIEGFLDMEGDLQPDLYDSYLIEYDGQSAGEIRQIILSLMVSVNQTLFRSENAEKGVSIGIRVYEDCNQILSPHIIENLAALPGRMHLGIIMDGNRRWGQQNGLPGHFFGTQRTEELLKWVLKIGNIKELTLYCLSIDNLQKRHRSEIDGLEFLLQIYLNHLISAFDVLGKELEIVVVGEKEFLSELTNGLIYRLEQLYCDETKEKRRLNLAIAYDPVKDVERVINYESSLRNDIDCIIRCGDVMRTSGFFPLNTLYSEWIFLPVLWPDFSYEHLVNCLITFGSRSRRYGA